MLDEYGGNNAQTRSLTAAVLGVIIGLAVAVVLQQQGVRPLDKITVFLLPAAIGLIAIVVVRMDRKGSPVMLKIALLITVPMTVFAPPASRPSTKRAN